MLKKVDRNRLYLYPNFELPSPEREGKKGMEGGREEGRELRGDGGRKDREIERKIDK